jgi:hypothetical protein
MQVKKKWSVQVGQFSNNKTIQPRYHGTWYWDIGYTDNLMPSFPIFFVEESSHGYARNKKHRNARKGKVIVSRVQAMHDANKALRKAEKEDDKSLPTSITQHLNF